MPSILTHYFYAQNALKQMEKNGEKANRNAFVWGAQGPDIFFYHRFMPWDRGESLTHFGTRLHNESRELYSDICRRMLDQNENAEPLRSYFLGTLCHFDLDGRAHPFINAKSAEYAALFPEKGKNYPWHAQIETALDIIILRYETGALPTDISLKMCAPYDRELMWEIGRFWQYVLRCRFGKEISLKTGFQLTTDMRRMFGYLNNRLMIKKPAVEALERMAGASGKLSSHIMGISEGDLDYSNTGHRPWHPPDSPDQTRTESFFEIYDNILGK